MVSWLKGFKMIYCSTFFHTYPQKTLHIPVTPTWWPLVGDMKETSISWKKLQSSFGRYEQSTHFCSVKLLWWGLLKYLKDTVKTPTDHSLSYCGLKKHQGKQNPERYTHSRTSWESSIFSQVQMFVSNWVDERSHLSWCSQERQQKAAWEEGPSDSFCFHILRPEEIQRGAQTYNHKGN